MLLTRFSTQIFFINSSFMNFQVLFDLILPSLGNRRLWVVPYRKSLKKYTVDAGVSPG